MDRNRHTISFHEVNGTHVGDMPAESLTQCLWTRDAVEVSRGEFAVHTEAESELLDELRPWLHWATVWDRQQPVWTGPVQKITIGRAASSIIARDVATFGWRTRVPLTKSWESRDPAIIAGEVYELMLDVHRIRVDPIVHLDPTGGRFDFSMVVDQRMVHQTMDDLVKLGLEWTVVKGVPVFGPVSRVPTNTLTEADFVADIQSVRDGTGTYNDGRIQGKNFAETTIVELAGLRLQTLVSLDSMFGVSNIQRASQQYVQQTARIRDALVIPPSASLHPDAPISLDELVPGNLFAVNARGIANVMKLQSMTVTTGPGTYDVQVTLETVNEQTEIEKQTNSIGDVL